MTSPWTGYTRRNDRHTYPNLDAKTTAILPRNLRGIRPFRLAACPTWPVTLHATPLGSSGLDVDASTATSAQGSHWCKRPFVKGSPFWGTRPTLSRSRRTVSTRPDHQQIVLPAHPRRRLDIVHRWLLREQ